MAIDTQTLIAVAVNESGYLEKQSRESLDDKTANAGVGNYTKYARDLVSWVGTPFSQGSPWCDIFVDWCFVTAFGVSEVPRLIGGFSAYTPTSAHYYKTKNQWYTDPEAGDQIFFHNKQRIYHTGIVTSTDAAYVYTIEGNTSSTSGVISNGGGVFKKRYLKSASFITGYGRPAYDTKPVLESPAVPLKIASGIRPVQTFLNQYYGPEILRIAGKLLVVDGITGPRSLEAAAIAFQTELNRLGAGIAVDGKFGSASSSAFTSLCGNLKNGSRGIFVTLWQCLLVLLGYEPNGIDGIAGNGFTSATNQMFRDKKITSDSSVSGADIDRLL